MAEMLIQSESLTAIADKIRVLSDTEDAMSLSTMKSHIEEANIDVATQADLIAQITSALEGKAAGGSGGSSGVAEPCTIYLSDSFDFRIYYSCISSDDNTIISGYINTVTTELHAYKNHILTMCVPYVSSIDAIGLDCSGVEYIENECNGNLMLVFKLTDEIVNIHFSDPFSGPSEN